MTLPGSVLSTPPKNSETTGKLKSIIPSNVFSNDGSFLDRIRSSIKDGEDQKKEKDALERKKNFADRFKTRGKRPAPQTNLTTTDEESPKKKQKKPEEEKGEDKKQEKEDTSAQAKYHQAMDSYTISLKDGGTGVRAFLK